MAEKQEANFEKFLETSNWQDVKDFDYKTPSTYDEYFAKRDWADKGDYIEGPQLRTTAIAYGLRERTRLKQIILINGVDPENPKASGFKFDLETGKFKNSAGMEMKTKDFDLLIKSLSEDWGVWFDFKPRQPGYFPVRVSEDELSPSKGGVQ